MRVTFLKLANVRTIEAAAFRFQPGVNLIVGVDGVGRTTVLDTLCVCLSAYVKQVNKPQGDSGSLVGTRSPGRKRACGTPSTEPGCKD